MRKLLSLALVPFAITSCWTPNVQHGEEYFVSDGINKTYSEDILAMLNDLDDKSLVNILFHDDAYTPYNAAAFNGEYGIKHQVTGTGFIIHQDLTHYYVATNHHVIQDFLKDARNEMYISKGNNSDNLISTPEYDEAWNPYADRATVQHADVIFDGQDVNYAYPVNQGHSQINTDFERNIDMAVFKIEITNDDNIGFEPGYQSVQLADPFIVGEDNRFDDEWTGYTIGYPAGYKRMNQGSSDRINYMTGDKFADEASGAYDRTHNTWEQSFYYEFFQAGGSSGSPIVNSNGELITLLANGYGTDITGGPSINEVNGAICNEDRLIDLISIAEC